MNKLSVNKLRKLPVRVLVFLFLIATVLALAFSVAWYAELKSQGVQPSFASGLRWYFLEIYLWLGLCPVIFLVNRRFPLAPRKVHIYILHALMAIVLPSLMRVVGLSIDRLVDPDFTANISFTFRYLAVHCAYRIPRADAS